MTAIVEHAREIGAVSSQAAAVPLVGIKARVADLWPLSAIALGLALTIIWTGSLLWLLLLLLF
jgi:hypothetical protein